MSQATAEECTTDAELRQSAADIVSAVQGSADNLDTSSLPAPMSVPPSPSLLPGVEGGKCQCS